MPAGASSASAAICAENAPNKRAFGPSLFLFMFYIFINIHHYFLDNVMWRRGNPDVQQYIFSAPNTAAR